MIDTPLSLISVIEKNIGNLYELKKDFKVSLIKYSENILYLLNFSDGEKRVFRIRRKGYHTLSEIRSELLFMNEISEETDVIIPKLFRGKNGDFMQKIISSDSREEYYCDMMSFAEGDTAKSLTGSEFEKIVEKIGTITAKLHMQSMNRKSTEKLERFSWNEDTIFGENPNWGDYRNYYEIKPQDTPIFEKAEKYICKKLKKFGRTHSHYGMIHADLHCDNIIVNGDTLTIIDFDDCGYGYYLYDLGCTLLYCSEGLEKLINCWCRGYEKIRLLSSEEKDMLMIFVVLRRIVRLAWLASHSDSDTAKTVPADYYPKTLEILNNMLISEAE